MTHKLWQCLLDEASSELNDSTPKNTPSPAVVAARARGIVELAETAVALAPAATGHVNAPTATASDNTPTATAATVAATVATLAADGVAANGVSAVTLSDIAPLATVTQYTVQALFSLPNTMFVVHWTGFDRLQDFTVQRPPLPMQECDRVETVKFHYPWLDGAEAAELRKIFRDRRNVFGLPMTFSDIWTLPYYKVWAHAPYKGARHKKRFLQRRSHVLAQCVTAMWALDDGANYLAHLVLTDNCQHHDKISTSFFVFNGNIDGKFFNRETQGRLLANGVAAKYPWQTGQQGFELISRHITDPNLTYQQLATVAPLSCAALSTTLACAPPSRKRQLHLLNTRLVKHKGASGKESDSDSD